MADYYLVSRLVLLGIILLVTTQCGSMLYLRYMLGREEVSRDSVPFLLCSLAQSVAWGQMLLLLLRTLDLAGDGAVAHALQTVAAGCLYGLTPFAYLFHEAVGGGHWGFAGFAGRAVEAATVLALIAACLYGFTSVLAELLTPEDASQLYAHAAADPAAADAAAVAAAAAAAARSSVTWWQWFWSSSPPPPSSSAMPPPSNPAHALLYSALTHVGLSLLLVTVPRGALHLVRRSGAPPPDSHGPSSRRGRGGATAAPRGRLGSGLLARFSSGGAQGGGGGHPVDDTADAPASEAPLSLDRSGRDHGASYAPYSYELHGMGRSGGASGRGGGSSSPRLINEINALADAKNADGAPRRRRRISDPHDISLVVIADDGYGHDDDDADRGHEYDDDEGEMSAHGRSRPPQGGKAGRHLFPARWPKLGRGGKPSSPHSFGSSSAAATSAPDVGTAGGAARASRQQPQQQPPPPPPPQQQRHQQQEQQQQQQQQEQLRRRRWQQEHGDAALALGREPRDEMEHDGGSEPWSLLAQPLPTRRSAALAALRASPQRALWLGVASLWAWLLGASLCALVAHTSQVIHPPPVAPPPPPEATHLYSALAWALGWDSHTGSAVDGALGGSAMARAAAGGGGDGAEVTGIAAGGADSRLLGGAALGGGLASNVGVGGGSGSTASWLLIHLLFAAALGHHLACRHQLRNTRALRSPSLQSALLQTAALQLQVAALPVLAHTLGLVPHRLASAYTTLPLCSTPLHAATLCAAFLAANAVGAALYLRS